MMQLLQPIEPVLAVLLYWSTIVFIGWSLIGVLTDLTKGKLVYKWSSLPLAAKFLIITATSFSFFGICTTIGYIFKLPSWWLGVTYFIGLGFAIVYAAVSLRPSQSSIATHIRRRAKTFKSLITISPLSVMLVLVLVDLVYHLFIGGLIGADGFIHVSKIRHLMEDGFTLTDAYYGVAPETRHTIGVMHTLIAVPSWLGVDPITSWYASEVFFRIAKISAVFYLGWRLLEPIKGKLRVQYAALIVILSLALFNNYIIAYPSVFVTAFLILFIIALLDVVQGKNFWILIMSSALIAWIHPIASVAMTILLALILLGLTLFDRKVFSKKFIVTIIASFIFLLSTPLLVSTLPNRMTNDVKNYGINQFSFISIDSHQAFKPTISGYFDTDSFTGLPWTVELLSLIGIVGLLLFLKDRSHRVIVGSAALFAPLILYNPVAFSILNNVLPVWGLARFNVVNQFVLVFCFFGLLSICLVAKRLLQSKTDHLIMPALFLATLIIFILTQSFGAVDPKSYRDASMYDQQTKTYGDLRNLSQVLPDDKNAVVFAERTSDSFMIPVVSPLRVVAINEFNSTPAADMTNRLTCSDLLYYYLDPGLMKQANVSYVLAQRTDKILYQQAIKEPKLRQIKQNDRWVLFKFDDTNVQATDKPVCHFIE